MNNFPKKVKGYLDHILYIIHPLAGEIDCRINRQWVISRSMVSNKRRYCYCRIPKCANSTIVNSLAYYDPEMTFDPTDQRGKYVKEQTSRLLSAKSLTVSSFTGKYFLFTFVRNPYSRVLSAYLDKIAVLEKKAYATNRQVIIAYSRSGQDLTFETFVSYLENGGLYLDPHWAPQTSMLPVGVKKIDFVGRVENLDKDLEYVVKYLFGENIYQGPVTREVDRTDSSNKLLKYYDTEIADRVYSLYKSDFDSFLYSKDLFVRL